MSLQYDTQVQPYKSNRKLDSFMDQRDSVNRGLCWNLKDRFIYHTFMGIFTQMHSVSFLESVLALLLGFRFRRF